MADEPIRVSAEAWTGPPAEPRPEPKPKRPPTDAEMLAISAALIGGAIVGIRHALATGAITIQRMGMATRTEDPIEYGAALIMLYLVVLFGGVLFAFSLRQIWRKRRGRDGRSTNEEPANPVRPDDGSS